MKFPSCRWTGCLFHALPIVVVAAVTIFGGCQREIATTGEILLIADGQPLAEIVVAEEPERAARFAAQELQTYLAKISGPTLTIVTEPSGGDVIPILTHCVISVSTMRIWAIRKSRCGAGAWG